MIKFINSIFRLKENNTNIKTELSAGLTTFFTMSYLFVLSPKILETAGINFGSALTITAIVAFIGSLLMAFIANKPYAVAPFLGETAFVSYTLTSALGFSVKTSFAAILFSGVILFIMTLFNLRAYIINKIPETIKISFCSGLGLFFIFIAFKDIGIINFTTNNIPLEFGNFTDLHVILGLFCFLLIIALINKGINSAIIISVIITTLIGIIIGDIELPQKFISMPVNITHCVFQTDLSSLLNKNFLPMLLVIFLLVNIDTSGAIVGLAYKSGSITKDGEIHDIKKIMIADSLAVITAPLLGTTTAGAYIDSMTGIKAGGKTGLTAFTVGCLFLLGLFFIPIISVIPAYAYAPALIYVGILMTSVITQINFNDITEYAPSLIIISIMIFSYNIGAGIMAGFAIYPLIKLLTGQINKVNNILWMMFILSVIFFMIYPY